MAGATQPYVIRASDYLTAIAYARGLKPDEIWQNPDNAGLRELRGNPEMLAPGDVLYLPAVKPKWLPVSVGSTNTFVASPPKVEVHVVLKGADGKPFAGSTVHLDPQVTDDDPTTDGDGLLKVLVPVTVKVLTATVGDDGASFQIRVGNLDPHDVPSGTLSRLRQLGYVGDESRLLAMDRPYLGGIDANDTALTRAVSAFQTENGGDVTGELDDDLCDQIRDEHGS
jgi:Putative peptidoglycan binding domain